MRRPWCSLSEETDLNWKLIKIDLKVISFFLKHCFEGYSTHLISNSILHQRARHNVIQVSYEVRLEDNNLVAKSDDVEFNVQDGHFVLRYQRAKTVKKMKKWEKVVLITVSNITSDNKVVKKNLKEGEGYELPNEGAIVQEQVIDGLDRAVVTVKKGEVDVLCFRLFRIQSRISSRLTYKTLLRAQAYINVVDLDLAELDIKKALQIDPDNRDVKLEYKVFKEKMREYNKKHASSMGICLKRWLQKRVGPMTIDSKA
ncbi:hypothetical protein LXL04_014826 [Taraxacum kok-saghyz]